MLLFEEIWKQIPYFNKRFITVSVFLYLISFTTPIFTLLFINIPAVTINQYQIHRLFTTLFINIRKIIIIRYIPISIRNHLLNPRYCRNRKEQRICLFSSRNSVLHFCTLKYLLHNSLYN